MKKLLSLLLLLTLTLCVKAQYENHWNPNPYQYANNMTVIGIINFNGVEQHSESIELGAFCGEECRGSVIPSYEEYFDRYYVFMMIYGNNGDSISFRCFDHKINMELDMIQETFIEFHTNDMVGDIIDPFVFSFKSYQHEVVLDILPEIGGTAIGEGIYNKYDTCYIDMNPNTDYQFDALVENEDTLTKQNHYSFIVLSDRHLKAYFSEIPVYYQITAEANPSSGGAVTGTGQYLEEEECTLQISTNPGYIYEGLYENEQLVTTDTIFTFVADADRHFVAEFSVKINHYQISADIFPSNTGTITGLGVYEEGTICNLEIAANGGYSFVALKENDMVISEETTYSFVVDSDRHFIAEFSELEYYYDISADVFPDNAGAITGLGVYEEGTICNLEITANEGYSFIALKENDVVVSEETTYSFVVDADHHFIAEFDLKECEVKLSANPEEGGTISGSGEGFYTYGTTVYAIAIPNDNYIFLNWKDENGTVLTSNPQYVFNVTSDISLTANFEFHNAVLENNDTKFIMYPNPTSDFLIIEKDNPTPCNMTIYDMSGKIVLVMELDNVINRVDIGNLSNGTYIIAFDNGMAIRKLIINNL